MRQYLCNAAVLCRNFFWDSNIRIFQCTFFARTCPCPGHNDQFLSIFVYYIFFSAPKFAKDTRSHSCVSEVPLLPRNHYNGCRRVSKAYLIKHRGSGDDTVVTLAPIGVTTTHVPTIAVGPKRGFKGSLNSLEMDEASMGREFQVSPDALEAQRLEKLVRNLRRQVSTHEEDVRWVQLSHVDIIDWFT